MAGDAEPKYLQPQFLDKLHVEPLPVAGDWKLLARFRYVTMVETKPKVITVPPGFVTDFASIPRPLRMIYEAWGSYGWAAVVHDYLCSVDKKRRRYNDKVLIEAMAVSNVPVRRQRIFWTGVRTWAFLSLQWG